MGTTNEEVGTSVKMDGHLAFCLAGGKHKTKAVSPVESFRLIDHTEHLVHSEQKRKSA